MEKRQSIEPTFNSSVTGPAYTVRTLVGGRHIRTQEIDDPFINTTVKISWRDLLRGLLKRGIDVNVVVSASWERMEDVMELDANYRGWYGSTRRDECDKRMMQAIVEHVEQGGAER